MGAGKVLIASWPDVLFLLHLSLVAAIPLQSVVHQLQMLVIRCTPLIKARHVGLELLDLILLAINRHLVPPLNSIDGLYEPYRCRRKRVW
jgi:hypothetical protein